MERVCVVGGVVDESAKWERADGSSAFSMAFLKSTSRLGSYEISKPLPRRGSAHKKISKCNILKKSDERATVTETLRDGRADKDAKLALIEQIALGHLDESAMRP